MTTLNRFNLKCFFQQVAVCIWFVHAVVVALNGAGFAKLSGQETAWELIGLANNNGLNYGFSNILMLTGVMSN